MFAQRVQSGGDALRAGIEGRQCVKHGSRGSRVGPGLSNSKALRKWCERSGLLLQIRSSPNLEVHGMFYDRLNGESMIELDRSAPDSIARAAPITMGTTSSGDLRWRWTNI